MPESDQTMCTGIPTHSGKTTAQYTVAALLAFVEHVRTAPGYSDGSMADIRSATRVVLRQLDLDPDTTWDLETVNAWAGDYADTPHADRVSPFTVRCYQDRLRAAARIFHDTHNAHLTLEAPSDHTVLVPDLIQPSVKTRDDLKLLAAAWLITPSEAITRLVDYYRHHASRDIDAATLPRRRSQANPH